MGGLENGGRREIIFPLQGMQGLSILINKLIPPHFNPLGQLSNLGQFSNWKEKENCHSLLYLLDSKEELYDESSSFLEEILFIFVFYEINSVQILLHIGLDNVLRNWEVLTTRDRSKQLGVQVDLFQNFSNTSKQGQWATSF